MSVDARAASSVASAARFQLAIVTALGIERATLPLHAPPNVPILQSGPGAERAAVAARAALEAGSAALLSWGFAGALVADIPSGTVVLPRSVVTDSGAALRCDRDWQAALAAWLAKDFAVAERPLLSAADVLVTPAAKAAAARRSGACAVDMESAAIAMAAASAGARFAAIRVIVDAAGDALPTEPERWIDPRGNRRAAALFGAVLAPRDWPVLWALGQRYRTARAVLVRLAERLGPRRFLVPGGAR
jgi:nucleoside phosphorylase